MTDELDWKTREKVVTIIERHLAPSAKIRRDVHLPVLSSKSGRTRQCDIVIEEGTEPRQTISIVEIQNRVSKPEINEFNGWIEKMREVGAQHLICVSDLGFPTSIEEKADLIGPTIRLLTLKQIEEGNWPIPPAFCSGTLEVVRYDKLEGLRIEYQHLVRKDPHAKNELPNPHEKIFRIEDGQLVSVTDIMDWHLFSNPNNIVELPKNQQIIQGVYFTDCFEHKTHGGDWVKLKSLLIQIKLSISSEILNWETATYEQRGWGEVGWVLKASTLFHSKKVDIITPFNRVGAGEYCMGRPITMSDYDTFLSINGKGYKAERYED